jgi:NADP-dependent 3-hydroxy acid dehydrogenase YdfG
VVKLVLGACRESRLQDLVKEVKELGGEAVYTVTDVTKVGEVEDTFGRIDV